MHPGEPEYMEQYEEPLGEPAEQLGSRRPSPPQPNINTFIFFDGDEEVSEPSPAVQPSTQSVCEKKESVKEKGGKKAEVQR